MKSFLLMCVTICYEDQLGTVNYRLLKILVCFICLLTQDVLCAPS